MSDDAAMPTPPSDPPAAAGPSPAPAARRSVRERARSLFAALAVVGAIAGGVGAVNRACIKPARRAWKASDGAATSVLKGGDDAAAAARKAEDSLTTGDAVDAGLETASQAKDILKEDPPVRKDSTPEREGTERP